MSSFSETFIETINKIQGNGNFCFQNEMNFIHPGLEIEGIGEIGLPLEKETAKKIIDVAKKAPFGKGSKTIIDNAVRNTWELDPQSFKLNNPDWEKLMNGILKEIKAGLGIEEGNIKASLYKLLLYEKDNFFIRHKDSEKEAGMFATLTICLPSTFEGGELSVFFDGKIVSIDFSKSSKYKIAFAAFYADCEHEIALVKNGYKLSLIYNLILEQTEKKIHLEKNSVYVTQISDLLKKSEDTFNLKPKIFILEHQYTPKNFNEGTLKLRDKQIVRTIAEAAKNANYYAKLCLLTHYKMGELESDDGYGYGDYYNKSKPGTDGSMGEVYEEITTLENWADDNLPSLGVVPAENADIINPVNFDEGLPINEEEEGYTGNAGMTIEYWYHYGAVALYPANKINDLLINSTEKVALEWLTYFVGNKNNESPEIVKSVVHSLLNFAPDDNFHQGSFDYSSLVNILKQYKTENWFNMALPVLINKFEQISDDKGLELFELLPSGERVELLTKLIERNNCLVVEKYSAILLLSIAEKQQKIFSFLELHFKTFLSTYATILNLKYQPHLNERKIKIIEQTIILFITIKSKELEKDFIGCIHAVINRNFIHKIIAPALLNIKSKQVEIGRKLVEICLNELDKTILNKPVVPPDWKRDTPKEIKPGEIRDILFPFLASPAIEKIEYKKAEAFRNKMENEIAHAHIDADCITIKKGTPYTLIIKKNNASYIKLLKKWTADCELKDSLLITLI